ncbi:MAG UNVERIFIED_CONTAM: hypothetical protein LVT10_00780 [Anaerolineae bacterium]
MTEPFWLNECEVTNALYGSVGCSPTSSATDQPRNCVDWYDAQAFCEAQGRNAPQRNAVGVCCAWGRELGVSVGQRLRRGARDR